MQTITNDYKNSQNSVLLLNELDYENFYMNLVEVPLLEKTLTERSGKNAYYPTLYRDIWFMIEQPYTNVQFNEKVDFSNEVLSQILQSIYDHPTFHIIHDLSNEKHGSSFVHALLLTEMVSLMIEHEVNALFDSNGTAKDSDLNEFIQNQLNIGNCLECAAQSILHALNELPIFFDMSSFSNLPLAEKTNYSLEVFNEIRLMDDVISYRAAF